MADPYHYIVQPNNFFISISLISLLVALLAGAQVAVQKLITPIDETQAERWFINAISDLSPKKQQGLQRIHSATEALRVYRDINSAPAIPALTSLWCVSSLAAISPHALPASELDVCIESRDLDHVLALRGLLGMTGLAVWMAGMLAIDYLFTSSRGLYFKPCLTSCTFAGICVWMFLLAPIAFHGLGLHCSK